MLQNTRILRDMGLISLTAAREKAYALLLDPESFASLPGVFCKQILNCFKSVIHEE